MDGIHISLAAERLGTLWGLPITNTLLMSWIVIALLTAVALVYYKKVSLVPGKFQTFIEVIIGFVYDYVRTTLGSDSRAQRFFPLLMTIFLFIATANLIEFTPGIGSIGFFHTGAESTQVIENEGGAQVAEAQTAHSEKEAEFVPLLRSMNTDLNVTLALAIIAVIFIEAAGIAALGVVRYGGKFLNFSSPVNFAVGLIELVSEVIRLVSFSFRLFGNIFAGEVLLAVAVFFIPYVLPSFLMSFELFVGIVQAAVFSLLTLFFLKIAMTDPHEAHAQAHK